MTNLNLARPILIVDDEEMIHKALVRCLSPKYSCRSASSAESAIELLAEHSSDLILLDIKMPRMDGLQLCPIIREKYPDSTVVMISGMVDVQYAVEAMQRGAFDYITKPFDTSEVIRSVERALDHQALLAAKNHYEQTLEERVQVTTEELRKLNQDLNITLDVLYTNYRATLQALGVALEAHDVESRGHSERVVAYCLRLGRELGLSHGDLICLEQGALLHDIGKIGVPDSILLKEEPLTQEQWERMYQHVDYGLSIIEEIDLLAGARAVVGQHHERYDGTGYPRRLCGEAIHINARIFAVIDAFDAMTSDRPYRAARSHVQARSEIVANAGRHFDPGVVAALIAIPESEWEQIRVEAASEGYFERTIDKREIRTFILSLKHTGTTGPLDVDRITAAASYS